MFLADEILRNDYYALRHGVSNPQKKRKIVSDIVESAKPEHGLAQENIEETRMAITDALFEHNLFTCNRKIIVPTSPASRSGGTSDIISEFVPSLTIVCDDLRERYFGIYNLKSNKHYPDVWALDAVDPDHTRYNVESVRAVLKRMTHVVHLMEKIYRDAIIILSSHGDPLQILETSFRGMDPSRHRELEPLKNAELRRLNVSA